MNIKQLRLENFKIFQKAEINFRPLTLLTGTNSSGKSTILNAITSILQTYPLYTFPFRYSPNGKYCQLGSFRDVTYGKNTKTNFALELTVTEGSTQQSINGKFRYSSSGNQILPDSLKYTEKNDGLEVKWTGQAGGYKVLIDSDSHNEISSSEKFKVFKNWLVDFVESSQPEEEKDNARKDLEGTLFRLQEKKWFKLDSKSHVNLIAQIKNQPAGNYMISRLTSLLKKLDESFSYIGPVRAYPSRYYQSDIFDQSIDSMGKNAVSMLFDWKKYYPRKFQEVIELIKLLELASEVSTETGLEEIQKLDVQPFNHRETVNLADVGFGLSQILPIIVADVALPDDGTLLVNQPEVHLHPSSQAQLGNYFSSRIKDRNYIIETHSEYLINRLRLLAVRKEINVDDISIIFVEAPINKNRKSPTIHYIEIGEDGSLKNAPKSFFQTYFLDTFNLAMGGFAEDEDTSE